jgi:hypothetical protein
MDEQDLPLVRMPTRRKIILGLSSLAICAAGGSRPAIAAQRRTDPYGLPDRGKPFPMEYPNSLGVAGHDWIDALVLNGSRQGGPGGDPARQTVLGADDYWSEFEVGGWTTGGNPYVHYLRFRPISGAEVSGGRLGKNMSYYQLEKNTYILRIGGRCGNYLDTVEIDYIQGFKPSTVVDADATAVLDFRNGGDSITTYTEKSIQTAQAFEKTVELVQTSEINVNA